MQDTGTTYTNGRINRPDRPVSRPPAVQHPTRTPRLRTIAATAAMFVLGTTSAGIGSVTQNEQLPPQGVRSTPHLGTCRQDDAGPGYHRNGRVWVAKLEDGSAFIMCGGAMRHGRVTGGRIMARVGSAR